MAAAEYFMGQARELPGNHPPHAYPPQIQIKPPQYQQQPSAQQYPQQPYNTLYHNAPSQQQLQTYPPPPPRKQQPYANNAPPPYPTGPNAYLGPPIQPQRSHSQPPRVHFADQHDSDSSDSSSSSNASSPRRHRRHRSRDMDSSSRHHHHHTESRTQRREHRDRDTFLGAGAGALVGDVIFPGLGTAAGIVLGGLGGRKYAKRARSEEHDLRRRRSDDEGYGERRRGKGWDERTATYKSGTAVR